jgi:hypothetical protein
MTSILWTLLDDGETYFEQSPSGALSNRHFWPAGTLLFCGRAYRTTDDITCRYQFVRRWLRNFAHQPPLPPSLASQPFWRWLTNVATTKSKHSLLVLLVGHYKFMQLSLGPSHGVVDRFGCDWVRWVPPTYAKEEANLIPLTECFYFCPNDIPEGTTLVRGSFSSDTCMVNMLAHCQQLLSPHSRTTQQCVYHIRHAAQEPPFCFHPPRIQPATKYHREAGQHYTSDYQHASTTHIANGHCTQPLTRRDLLMVLPDLHFSVASEHKANAHLCTWHNYQFICIDRDLRVGDQLQVDTQNVCSIQLPIDVAQQVQSWENCTLVTNPCLISPNSQGPSRAFTMGELLMSNEPQPECSKDQVPNITNITIGSTEFYVTLDDIPQGCPLNFRRGVNFKPLGVISR